MENLQAPDVIRPSATAAVPQGDGDVDNDQAPETPTNEPEPVPIQDPPPDETPAAPMSVTYLSSCPT